MFYQINECDIYKSNFLLQRNKNFLKYRKKVLNINNNKHKIINSMQKQIFLFSKKNIRNLENSLMKYGKKTISHNIFFKVFKKSLITYSLRPLFMLNFFTFKYALGVKIKKQKVSRFKTIEFFIILKSLEKCISFSIQNLKFYAFKNNSFYKPLDKLYYEFINTYFYILYQEWYDKAYYFKYESFKKNFYKNENLKSLFAFNSSSISHFLNLYNLIYIDNLSLSQNNFNNIDYLFKFRVFNFFFSSFQSKNICCIDKLYSFQPIIYNPYSIFENNNTLISKFLKKNSIFRFHKFNNVKKLISLKQRSYINNYFKSTSFVNFFFNFNINIKKTSTVNFFESLKLLLKYKKLK